MKKLKSYNGENFKNWYCIVDENGNPIASKTSFIGTLGGCISLIHKSDLSASCYKFCIFKPILSIDLPTIERIVKQQAYGMADRQLSQIPPRMQINEYWNNNIEAIKEANFQIFN